MRIVNNFKLVEMMNSIYQLHDAQHAACPGIQLEIASEKKQGMAWRFVYRCKICKFKSPEYKLFTEIEQSHKPGPNPALINRDLQSVLLDTPMGPTRTRVLLSGLDIPPPTATGMRRTANKVAEQVTQLATEDMNERLEEVKATKLARGDNRPDVIDVSVDARYNAIGFGSTKKPGQRASQAYSIAMEKNTEMEYIVAMAVENKLCWTGAWLRGEGYEVQCPGGHEGCTANLAAVAPHSEFEMGKAMAENIFMKGMLVRYAVTDGDAKSAAGFNSFCSKLIPQWKVTRMADTVHLSSTQFKHCNNAVFSRDMFPDASTKADYNTRRLLLSKDVRARCNAICKELMNISNGDLTHVTCKIPRIIDATLACYADDHSKCLLDSVVCTGDVTDNWWTRSKFLGPNQLPPLQMNENDKKLMADILKMRLSEQAFQLTRYGYTTQKNEAFNRSCGVNLPKNVNYSRNFSARVSSTILKYNCGIAESIRKKRHRISGGINYSVQANTALDRLNKEFNFHREYSKRPEVTKKRHLRRGYMEKAHYQYKQSGRVSDYKKGQLDKADHSYSQDPEHSNDERPSTSGLA
ncbi:MAG: hypothetical protein ABW185_17390 [Sedimenticola sp.]